MILVDLSSIGKREDEIGSRALQAAISKQGVLCDLAKLRYADACFEGNGPEGLVGIGVERKRISDMLTCIDDGRFTGHQRVGMGKMYQFTFLILEGYWKPDPRNGVLQEGHPKSDGSIYWSSDRPGGGRRVMYQKLRRYLFSMSLGGVIVLYSRDIQQSAYDITELYHYFQKPWNEHQSLKALHDRSGMLPSLNSKPSLVQRWAFDLEGVGVKLSEDAARVFKTPLRLANADEKEWMAVPGIGYRTAQEIVKDVMGVKR